MRRRARRSERGSILVEFALIFPILMFLALGVFEIGLMWRTSLTLANSVRSGARVGASVTSGPLADHAALAAVGSSIASINKSGAGRATITYVEIYKANASNLPPAVCNAASSCNSYTSAQVAAIIANQAGTQSNFGSASSCVGKWDANWCPKDRSIDLSSANGPDYVGVAIRIVYTPVTPIFFSSTRTMSDQAVMRLEPVANLGS